MAINRNASRLAAAALWTGLGAALFASAGCAAAGKALGVEKVTPDEFRVVSKAPLVVPPDYALRPPAPGEPRPQELAPESQARLALMGRNDAARSQGENLLAEKAGATRADPLIRYVVDDEFGDVTHKDRSFADRVLFWKKDSAPATPVNKDATAAATTDAPVDPAAEAAKVKSLTGDQPITIQKAKPGGKVKLPGL